MKKLWTGTILCAKYEDYSTTSSLISDSLPILQQPVLLRTTLSETYHNPQPQPVLSPLISPIQLSPDLYS